MHKTPPAIAVLALALAGLGALADRSAAADAPSPRTLRPEDVYRSQELSDPQVSPDGAWVAYVVSTNDQKADEERSALWMASWDGTQQLALTRAAKTVRSPRWSPDGRYLAFLGSAEGTEENQLFVLDRRGGEPRPITHVEDTIEDFCWSPDGAKIVFTMQAAAAKPPKPIVIRAPHFKEDEEGYLGVGGERHLYVTDLDGGPLTALDAGSDGNDELPAWSPDGRLIAFVRTRHRGADLDGACDLDVVAPVAGAAVRTLARVFAPNAQHLAWSPDGRRLAFLEGLEPRFNAYIQDRLAVIDPAGGMPRVLTDRLDRAVAGYAFAPDSATLSIAVEDDGSLYPATLDAASGAVTRLVDAPSVVSGLATGGGHLAVLWSNDAAPAELFALEGRQLRRLSHHNDALMAELRLGATSDLRFKSRDGTEIHGLLVTPPDYVRGRRYPAVLWIHGGPNGQDQHSFDFGEYQFRRQMLAGAGYVVIGINYRGSSGRGASFARAIFADWGHKEVEDLLAGVDQVVAGGYADPQRLGIGGWSYGGILTDYTIASDRRFKAAVSGAGSANQVSLYGADQYILQDNHEIGPPWRNQSLWLKISYPFWHADRIHTPTLFMGGDKDFNVPIAGGEQMYAALQTLGVPAELIVYPGQFHGISQPSFVVDRYTRIADWYSKFLR
jgi:dipeptidyl aminopeptidase/acylaminoacyl peptidase